MKDLFELLDEFVNAARADRRKEAFNKLRIKSSAVPNGFTDGTLALLFVGAEIVRRIEQLADVTGRGM